jgi:cell division protein ZapA
MGNKVVVNIYGEDYAILGESDPVYISKIAEYVDSKMSEVSNAGQISSRDKVAILAAMSIASELKENNERLSNAQAHFHSDIDRVIARLDDTISRGLDG